jgi:hypothetical protein
MPLQDKTVDDLLPVTRDDISDANDYVYIRTSFQSERVSRKISVEHFRSLMFRNVSTTAMDILANVTATAQEINVLRGVNTDANTGVTAERINYLAGVSPGVSSPNKVLVLGSNRNVDVLKVQEFYIGSTPVMVEATAAELNRLHNVPNGLTRTDLGNLPRLLEMFLDPSVTVGFPDFSMVGIGQPFSVTVSNLRVMRGAQVNAGTVNVRMVINGATQSGGIREGLNGSAGGTTLQFTRGAVTNATEVAINNGTNNYTLELTFRGLKLSFNGSFVGSSSSNDNPRLD